MAVDRLETRTCTRCKEEKTVNNFYLSSKRGFRHWCKACCNDTNKEWNRKNKESVRNTTYKTTYGITSKDIEIMHASQGGGCKICNKPLELVASSKNNVVHVDHCHTTGQVRGLLCNKCNTGLGMFRDNKEFLQKAIEYLDESR